MKSQRELESKWVDLDSRLLGHGPVSTQSETNHIWMLAQKELLEWVLS